MEFFQLELPNGIRCVHRPVKTAVSYCALTVNAGSRDERAAEHGMAHSTEHCLFKGTEHLRAHQINRRLENLGRELNVFTTEEETVVYASTPRKAVARPSELIAE